MIFITLLQSSDIAINNDSHLEDLIYKIAAGNKEALERLYVKTKSAVYGFSLSIIKNNADAEDVLQETYIKIWTNAQSYTAHGTPMAWILTIARNLALMKIREKKRFQDIEPEEWERCFAVSDEAENTEARQFLIAALRILTEEERQIIMLHAVSGLKHREIGDLLQMALPTVLSKYHRALKKLKNYMEGEK